MLKLDVEEAKEISWGGWRDYHLVHSEQVDTSRWANIYEGVFKDTQTGKFYGLSWRKGTGDMGERPFEYDTGPIECPEMEEYEVTVKKYRKKK